MKLEYEFTYTAALKAPVSVGAGPFGLRMFYEISGGTAQGNRIRGRMLTGGGDWILLGPDGWGRLDVRGQLETDDGAVIYVSYQGLLEMNERVQQATASTAAATDYPDQYFRTTPRLETGDSRYAWVNRTVFVAEGRIQPGPAVQYRVYRVE
jgi:hypothetical protein